MSDPKLEARNPNTSPKRLMELLYGFTDDVLENPALPLILLENPSWLAEAEIEPLLKLLLRPDLPEYLVNALTQHPNPSVVCNAQMHVALGTEVTDWGPLLRGLAGLDCDVDDREVLERYELIPRWLKTYLEPWSLPMPELSHSATEPGVALPLTEERKQELIGASERELCGIAGYSKSPEEVEFVLELALDSVAQFASRNPVTPLLWLKKLMGNPHNWPLLASNIALTPDMLADLLKSGIEEHQSYTVILANIAQNPNCTPELAAYLKQRRVDPYWLARFYSPEELEGLFRSGHPWVVEHVRKLEKAPRWLVAECLTQDMSRRRTQLPLFCALLVLDGQKRLASNTRSKDWYTRFAIAIHPGTKPKTLEKLVSDANRYVRFAAKARTLDPAWNFTQEVGHG